MITTINEFKNILFKEPNKTISVNERADRQPDKTIYFRNWTQKCLWDNEISGQISDGMWENSPNSNWEFWTGLKTSVDSSNPHIDTTTYGRVNFNLASAELLDIVGDRMIAVAKMSKISQDPEMVKRGEYLEGVSSLEGFMKIKQRYETNAYFKQIYDAIPTDLVEQWLGVEYTMKNLQTDLRDMADLMKTAGTYNNTKGSNRIKAGFESKDLKRIEDLITKAKGDDAKAVQLATTMANKITDGRKAIQRANAATSIKRDEIAQVFRDRAQTLGIV